MAKKIPNEMNLQKDFLTIAEAAVYCGVSERHFRREIAAACTPHSVYFMGKRLFKREDLRHAIEKKYLIL